jgi:hypothetical protein
MNTDSEKLFEDKKSAASFYAHRCGTLAPLDDDQIVTLAETLELLSTVEVTPKRPPGATPALSKMLRYVVRDDDLNLFDSAIDAIKTSVSVGFFIAADFKNPAVWGAVTALLAGLGKLARNAVQKGKVLDPLSFQVLYTLKHLGETSEKALLAALKRKDKTWTATILASTLGSLNQSRMNDHSVRELVYKTAVGNWQVGNI